MRVLLVEDSSPLLRSIAQGLREAGYAVETAADGAAGLALAEGGVWDAIVLDVMLPGVDGLTIVRRLRDRRQHTPVLLLTARDTVDDRVAGLDVGADDYLVKPFAFAELLARVRALIRRRYRAGASTVRIGELELDTSSRTLKRAGVPVELSAREYALLEYLASRRGQVVTRAEIWDHVYDFASEPASNVVDVYIGYLRKKIDPQARLLRTRRGQGYVLGEP